MTNKRYIFGQWQTADIPLTHDDAVNICKQASAVLEEVRNYPQDKVLRTLQKLQTIWGDPNSTYRKQAAQELPKITGFSEPMIAMALDELSATLDPDHLFRKFINETNGVPMSPEYSFNPQTRTILSTHGIGTVFHVLSGNVFLVGVGSWLEGIITGNVNILKMSSNEVFFMPLFLQSLNEVDSDGVLSKSVAAIDIRSSNLEVIEVFKQNVDGLVIWGGEDAVRTYRNGLPARTRVVVFGPKVSFAVLTADGVKQQGIEACAAKIAEEIAIWDQNACTAPQVCFVETEELSVKVLDHLNNAMKEITKKIPSGTPPNDTAAEIRKIRGVQEIAESRGDGKLYDSGLHNVDWTVYLDKTLSMDLSPLHRTLRVTPFHKMSDILELASPMRGYLQTVGVIGTPQQYQDIYHRFSGIGVQRVFELGRMFAGEIDDPHDGAYDLPQLLNISVARMPSQSTEADDPWDHFPYRQAIINSRLRKTIDLARKTKFYAPRLKGLDVQGSDDFEQVPLLQRSEWEEKMLPRSRDLAVKDMAGGYVTQSGGSTGIAKFSYFSQEDWNTMLQYATRVFRSMGISRQDRIGNFLSATDMYGGFVSFNHVSFALGAQCYTFGPTPSADLLMDAFKTFAINTLIGFPPSLMRILREAKALQPSLRIDKIIFAGSPLSKVDRMWLSEELGCKHVVSIIGTTEANHIAYQCSHQIGTSFHHASEDYNYLEIVDETGHPCEPGTFGRVVVSSLHKKNFPVVRYVIGDKAAWTGKTCTCVRQDRVLDYQGRWDSIVCVGNMNVDFSDIKKSLQNLPISQIQMIIRHKADKEQITLICETAHKVAEQEVRAAVLKGVRDLEHHLNLVEFTVEIVAIGQIPRNPRTGKIKELVDERSF